MKITIQGQDYTVGSRCRASVDHRAQAQRALHLPVMVEPARQRQPCDAVPLSISGGDRRRRHDLFHWLHRGKSAARVCGLGLEGPRYRTAIQAVSDEMLLDQMLMPPSAGVAARVRRRIARFPRNSRRIDGALDQGLSLSTPVGKFAPDPGANWSKSAGQVAGMARAAYRARERRLDSIFRAVHRASI